jgi:hypothetical protein
MEKTIQMMKKNGLFDGLVHEIMSHDMPKCAVADILDEICCADGNFEDTFFNDLHELGLSIVWKELCHEATIRHEAEAQKQETIEDLLKKVINLLESK